jgi:hypothetical protein
MSKKVRDDLRSVALASVDQKAFELRARVYLAVSGLDDRLMHEALGVFARVKVPSKKRASVVSLK